MTELRCTVQTCAHNKNQYCALESITVGGHAAKHSSETCCDSFKEKKGDSFSNSTREASPTSNIKCKAEECKFNNQCKCHASKIDVEGRNACTTNETECATFVKA